MRLRRLGLSRYGMFTDHTIDFGERIGDGPDLHIIYGPNETGKSTALAGFLDLLFGIELRSRYSFLHGYEAMRIESDLEIGGQMHRFVRVRKTKASLLDEHGQPIADGVIANALGGMDRDAYKAMFSLDDDTLEGGGEEILRSEGDLGQLLFAASAGLIELSKTLKQLREGTENFHKGRTRNTELYKLKAELSRLDKEKKELDTVASAFTRLITDRDRAKSAYDEAISARAELETERENAERLIQGLPWLSEIHRLRGAVMELGSLPEAPQVWFEQVGSLIDQEPRLTTRLDGLKRQKRQLTEKCEVLVDDDAILGLESRIAQLDKARARYLTAAADLPKLRSRLSEYDGTIRTVTRRLSEASGIEPTSLVVPAGVVGSLNDLVEQRSGLDERLKTTTAEMENAEAAVGTAHRAVEETSTEVSEGEDSAFDRLNTANKTVQADDYRARLAMHMRRRNELKAALDAQIAQLHPWDGVAEVLTGVRVPETGEMDVWRSALDQAAKDIDRLEREEARLLADRNRLSGLMDAKRSETGVVGDEEAARLRTLRDEAWQTHRATLDATSADTFEERLKDDDDATAARIVNTTELAKLRQASEDLREKTSELERNAGELALVHKQQRQVRDEVDSAVQIMVRTGAEGLSSAVTLPKLTTWIDRRTGALKTLEELGSEDAEIARASKDENRHRGRLAKAMTVVRVEHDPASNLEDMIKIAQAAVESDKERLGALRAARQEVERAQTELDRRRRDVGQADRDDAKWHADWTDTLSRCWLGGADPEPSTAAARRILEDVAFLESTLENRASMADRIGKMEQDQAAFTADVRGLVEQLGDTFDAGQVVAINDGLRARLGKTTHDRKAREKCLEEIASVAADMAGVENSLAELRAVANEMFKAFGVDSLREVDEKLQKVTRRTTVREELSGRETRLVESMKARSLEEAVSALENTDSDELEREIAEIKARLGDASGRTNELYLALGRAEDAISAVGGDNAVARLEAKRRTVLLDIEEGALAYLRTRLGIEAAERALSAYRDEHRSSMMKRASEAFRTISRGVYSRLDAQLTDKGEVLMGIGASGGAKVASEMSKGARFQLYLALRVAGYFEFVDQHGPVPFVADDILETFDDFRAEEAFRLFTEMAGVGQVIYLSHHRHLCEIAREVCPNVTIHELPELVLPVAATGADRDRPT